MTTSEHLQRIKAKCEQLLELAAKRTPGKWTRGKPTWNKQARPFRAAVSALTTVCNTYDAGRLHEKCVPLRDSLDAAFIAACAGSAEAGWRATIAAIDDAKNYPAVNQCLVSKILAAWPEELL